LLVRPLPKNKRTPMYPEWFIKAYASTRVAIDRWIGEKLVKKFEKHRNYAFEQYEYDHRVFSDPSGYYRYDVPKEPWEVFYDWNYHQIDFDERPFYMVKIYRYLWDNSPYPFWKKVWRMVFCP
jgi:hypothetical protein